MLPILKRQTGDTLIEIILAMALLALIISSSVGISLSAFRGGAAAKRRTDVVNLMQEQAEALRWLRNNSQTWTSASCPGTGFICANKPDGVHQYICDTVTKLPEEPDGSCNKIFHMERNLGRWETADGPEISFQPYTIEIRAIPYTNDKDENSNFAIGPFSPMNLIQFQIRATWQDGEEKSSFIYALGNRDRIAPFDCSAQTSKRDPGVHTGQSNPFTGESDFTAYPCVP